MLLKRNNIFSLLISTSILIACSDKKPVASGELQKVKESPKLSGFPETTTLSSLKKTSFVATLEDRFTPDKNIIYAPAFLYAWEKLKTRLDSPLTASKNASGELISLMQSRSYFNSLDPSEYQTNIEVENDRITAKAIFNKSLPFEFAMTSHKQPLKFKNTEVASFGMYHFDYDVARSMNLVYYKNDDHFILKLIPESKADEIYLWKGTKPFHSLTQALYILNETLQSGKKEVTVSYNAWKYNLEEMDSVAIPKIRFNIETDYDRLINQIIYSGNGTPLSFEVAKQRTGFILNEKGAVIESEGEITLTTVDTGNVEPPRPKKLIFDKPFLIVVKKKDRSNPYFVMQVDNPELMEKFRR